MITKVDIPPDDRHEYTGLSTDTKPLAGDGSLFYELDTEDIYYAMYGNWWKVGTEATPLVPGEVKLLSDTVTTVDNGGVNMGAFTVDWLLATDEGVTFKVVFDGTAYTATTYETELGGDTQVVLGATYDGASFDFSDYPFIIANGGLATETAGEHTVELYATANVAQITLTNVAESTNAVNAWMPTVDEDGVLAMPLDSPGITAGESISVGAYYFDFPFYYVNSDGNEFPARFVAVAYLDGGELSNIETNGMTYNNFYLCLEEGATAASAEFTVTNGGGGDV